MDWVNWVLCYMRGYLCLVIYSIEICWYTERCICSVDQWGIIGFYFFFFFFLKKKCKIFDRAFPNFTSWYYRQTVDNRSSKKHFLWRKSDQILSIFKALLDPFTKWYKRLTLRSTKFWVKSTLDRAS